MFTEMPAFATHVLIIVILAVLRAYGTIRRQRRSVAIDAADFALEIKFVAHPIPTA